MSVVVVAGLLVPALIATDAAGRVADSDFERYVQIEPGSTSTFATRTNGEDTGALFEQVLAPAQVDVEHPSAVAVGDHFENFVGTGRTQDVRTTTALEEDRDLTFGSRVSGGGYQQSTPPEVTLRAPLTEGASWTWRGTRRGGTGRTVNTITEVADRTVLGRTFHDCVTVRAESRDTDANGNPSTDVTESRICPDAGLVLVREVFRQGGTTLRFESSVVEIHHPGLNLGGDAAAAASGGPAEPGQTYGVDAGRSWDIPGARLSTDRLAWSLARKSDALYPPVGSGDDVVTAEDDGTIASTDVRTGRVNWQIGLTGPIVASPVVAGDLVLAADAAKSLWALDSVTGRARWALRLPDVVSAAPATTGGVAVFPTDDGTVRGVSLATGTEVWTQAVNGLVVEPPVVTGGLVVYGDQAGNLTAVRPADGSVAWTDSSMPLFGGGTVVLGGLAAGGGTLVASTDSATVFAFDAATGDPRWRIQAPNTVDRAVAIAGDRVAIASQDTIEVRDAGTGRLVWRRDTDTSFAPPMVLGGTVAVLQRDNRLLTFSLANGGESPVDIGRPDAPSDQDTQLPMAWVAGALVVPTRNVGPWPFSVYQAFPAPRPSDPAEPVQGVLLAGEFYGFDTPSGPASLDGRRLIAPGEDFGTDSVTGKVVESQPGGPLSSPTTVLYRNKEVPSYALPSGDRVVAQFGSEIVGVSRTGAKPWAAPGPPSLPGSLPVVAGTGAGDVLVTPDAAGGLSGLDTATGRTLWGPVATAKFAFGGPTALPDGTVAWGGGAVSVVDPETGEVLRRNPDVSSLTTLAADSGLLFGIFAAGNNAALGAVDAATLQPVWAKRFEPAKILGAVPVAPGAGDGVVAVVDSANVLRVLDGRTGDERWHLRLRLAPTAPAVVWDGRVWVEEPGLPEDLAQHEHRVTVLDAQTGAMEASWEIPGAIFFSDMFRRSGDRVLVTVPSGIVAVRPEER